ncbi:E3 ubiquitin-ligase ORTHRUS 2-like [Micractinium conductrix]|uniref:E3 ubiquitin-ligase ORTHRUS 2-like n=1 Tax=Micractinium conductrix TaxID=554055 RepID=A0A2P6VI97_9CHLO|nr:E3 ubiquitin-ligase ORTHRUS 2-like [Micractinium conductrix]|eukprot:PSC73811.1 E3 ubiquitin-ligase ORTHRUS 2-like [Micractinium conductrix]
MDGLGGAGAAAQVPHPSAETPPPAEASADATAAEPDSRCAICLHPPERPATVSECHCGRSYCLVCLQQWCRTRRSPRCPLCQAEIQHIVCDGEQQPVPPPDRLEEEGPDLGCLDHAYFMAEAGRLLCRARAVQMRLVPRCGRRGGAGDEAADTLQQVVATLETHSADMQQELPFQPEDLLSELYSLDQLVQSIAAGSWPGGGGGGPPPAGMAQRFGADDWGEHSDDSHGGWSEEDEDGLDSRTHHRLERGLSSTPGRRPPGGGISGDGGRRRGSAGSLAASKGSGSQKGGGGRRR